MALAWTALSPRPTADAIFEFNRASDWTEFREAAADVRGAGQNLVYADREGNIGYQAPGRSRSASPATTAPTRPRAG